MPCIFLHGLDSSSRGSKGSFFREHFPDMLLPDFSGSLAERMATMRGLLSGLNSLIIVGSSYGGLMATLFTLEAEERVRRLILLAPALNFSEFHPPHGRRLATPALCVIGRNDTVTPAGSVIPIVQKLFTNPQILMEDDDHLLRHSFPAMDWKILLSE